MPVKSVTTKPLKPHCLRSIGHQPFVGCGRYAVYLVERRHYTAHTCLYGGLIGVHIFVEHAVAAHVYRVVVAARFACPVEGEVLDAGSDFIVALELVGEVGSLITVYHRFWQLLRRKGGLRHCLR